MRSTDLQKHTDEIVASIMFAWTQLKPESLQTLHSLALKAAPATAHLDPAPLDQAVTFVGMNISVRPSEMQKYFIDSVIPTVMVGLQSIAEDTLNAHFGDGAKMAARIRDLARSQTIPADLASDAHFWRMVRNVAAHGSGTISALTEQEANRLLAQNEITFTEFALWGPLLDAGHGGIPVPLTEEAQLPPNAPGSSAKRVPIVAGNAIAVGLGDVLACGRTWSRVLELAT